MVTFEHYLEAIIDVFELAKVAATLRSIKPDSKWIEILRGMLQSISDCENY